MEEGWYHQRFIYHATYCRRSRIKNPGKSETKPGGRGRRNNEDRYASGGRTPESFFFFYFSLWLLNWSRNNELYIMHNLFWVKKSLPTLNSWCGITVQWRYFVFFLKNAGELCFIILRGWWRYFVCNIVSVLHFLRKSLWEILWVAQKKLIKEQVVIAGSKTN